MVIPVPVGNDLELRGRPWLSWLLILFILGTFVSSRYFAGPLATWMRDNCAVVPNEMLYALRALAAEPELLWRELPESCRRLLVPGLGHMLVHGHEIQVLTVALYLWVFGTALERSMGSLRYALFLLLTGLLALAAHLHLAGAVDRMTPMVGMSGAVAGLLGGFLVAHPKAHTRLLFWLVLVFRAEIPSFILIALWFLAQLAITQHYETSLEGCQSMLYSAQLAAFGAGLVLVWPFLFKLQRRKLDPEQQKRGKGKGRARER